MTAGKVIFSMWDQLCTGDNQHACPDEKRVIVETGCNTCTCERFGNAGTGAKCHYEYDGWTLDTSYSFLTMAEPMPGDKVRYKGYFYAPELSAWKIIASMTVDR